MIKNIVLAISLILLAIIGCTKLAQKYTWDITQNKSNTLSATSKQLIDELDSVITITVYSPDMEILNASDAILAAYKKYSPKIQVGLQQTVLDHAQTAKLNVATDHTLVVQYKETQKGLDIRLNELNQQQISALIQQVLNSSNHWLVFLTGHQEADPLDATEFGLSDFAQIFAKQGMHITTLNLAQQQTIPQNTAVLIIANPQQDFLPHEKALLHQYVCNGGKLIWLTEPDATITAFIAEEFGLKPAKGVAIDPESSRLGSPHPALKIMTQYPDHEITKDIHSPTIMPWSGHLQILYQANDWEQHPFLTTKANTWTYNGPATKDLVVLSQFQEITGPLNIGIALSRTKQNQEQRALVIADTSFVINRYLQLYANTQLATKIISWTQNDQQMFIFNEPPLKDLSYHPSKLARFLQQYVFTILFPIILIGIGFSLGRSWRNGWPKLHFRFRIK